MSHTSDTSLRKGGRLDAKNSGGYAEFSVCRLRSDRFQKFGL